MDKALYIVEGLTYLLSWIVDSLSVIILVLSISLFAFWTVRKFILFFTYLWRGDPQWRDHGFEIMMMSELFLIAYYLRNRADQAVDTIDQRADLIDKALSEGKDPYNVVNDAGL